MQPKYPFTLTFGVVPNNYIHRAEAEEEEEIRLKFLESDTGLMYLITGVRGSGKTVFMENIVDHVSQVKKSREFPLYSIAAIKSGISSGSRA